MSLDAPETGYNKAIVELKQLRELLMHGEKKQNMGGKLLGEVTPLFEKEQYCEMVEKAKHHIKEGDIFQIVLSNRLSAPFEGSLFDTYRVLRTINPSPYMFYFSGTDVEVAGASPETLVKLENGVLHTFPLAGTRPRGATAEEDKKLEEGLLKDEKELAEHNMLVDLGRNDLGKVSKFGSVQGDKLHSIERYSHVMHIGSTVRGEIREEYDALDAIEAVLPAGSGLKGACGGWLDRLYYVSGAWLCKWNSTGLWSYGKPCVWCEKREAFEALCGFSYHSYCDCFSGAHDSDSACVEAASYLAQYT